MRFPLWWDWDCPPAQKMTFYVSCLKYQMATPLKCHPLAARSAGVAFWQFLSLKSVEQSPTHVLLAALQKSGFECLHCCKAGVASKLSPLLVCGCADPNDKNISLFRLPI